MAEDPTDRWSVNLEETTLLGRYTVERKIGGGGMASVYLAQDDQLEMPVVVKVPHTAYLAEPGFRERFDRETRDLISLQHPNIVRILARGEHEGLPFLVLQFLRGGSLGDRIREAKGAPIPYDEVRPWVRDVCRALDFIHRQGVVHRDIKPDNVLFDEHGNAYLSDFGIAKAVGGADTGLTVTGTTPGSPAYMAPEQPRQSSLTGASDQYSLAATLYEALSGRPTHEGNTAVDVLLKKQTELPPPLARIAPGVPAEVSDAVMRALQRDPDERWPTCEAMVEAFGRPPSEAPTAPAPGPAPPPAPQPLPPRPAPTEHVPPRPATYTSSSTTTVSSASRRSIFMVLAALCLAVPLALLFAPAGGDDLGSGGGMDKADAPLPTDAEVPEEPLPTKVDEPPDVKVANQRPAWARELVGNWIIDKRGLERRIKDLRGKGKRPSSRKLPGRLELERMLRSNMGLALGADGRFVLRLKARNRLGMEIVAGVWKPGDGSEAVIYFTPDPPKPDDSRKTAITTFLGHPTKGGLLLERFGMRAFLKKK